MESITITISTNREQLEAYIKTLANQINEMHTDLNEDKLGEIHCLANLLKNLTNNLPTQKS